MDERQALIASREETTTSLVIVPILKWVTFALLAALAIAQIAFGSMHFHECPVEPKIPIYLIVYGAFSLYLSVSYACMEIYKCISKSDEQQSQKSFGHLNNFNSLVHVFLFTWFITGCAWVYRVFEPDFVDVTSPLYCEKTVYLLAFWFSNCVFVITIVLISIAVMYLAWRHCFASSYL